MLHKRWLTPIWAAKSLYPNIKVYRKIIEEIKNYRLISHLIAQKIKLKVKK
jgi:hypothetical protein